jgi:hypothetical protein
VTLYRIDLPWATYGIEVKNGIVTSAPPLLGWMVGSKLRRIEYWVVSKGGKIVKNIVE